MKRTSRLAITLLVVIVTVAAGLHRAPQAAASSPTIEQFLAPGTPIEIASANGEALLRYEQDLGSEHSLKLLTASLDARRRRQHRMPIW